MKLRLLYENNQFMQDMYNDMDRTMPQWRDALSHISAAKPLDPIHRHSDKHISNDHIVNTRGKIRCKSCQNDTWLRDTDQDSSDLDMPSLIQLTCSNKACRSTIYLPKILPG